MVFDNYDDAQSYSIRKFIPENKLGRVIITSRHKDSESLADKGNRIELQGLNDTEAIQLLLLESEKTHSNTLSLREHATAIVHRLAYHPLAIAQAGAYIRTRDLELQDFLNHYNKRQGVILKNTTPLMSEYWKKLNESSQEIPMSVFTTCELSFQQLLDLEETEQRGLPDFLTLLAYFDPRDVPEGLFEAYSRPRTRLLSIDNLYADTKASLESEQRASKGTLLVPYHSPGLFLRQYQGNWDSTSFYEALLVLRRLSLVQITTSGKGASLHASLHPLIRDWLRLRTPRHECQYYSSVAAACVYKILAGTRDWAAFQMTLPEKQLIIEHINAYATNIKEFGTGYRDEAFDLQIHHDIGLPAVTFSTLLYQNGQYKTSAEWARRSLAQRLQQFGAEAHQTLATKTILAGALYSQGEHREAKQLYKHIVEVKERTLGAEHPETLLSKVNLAPLLMSESQYGKAEVIYRQAFDVYEKTLGQADPNTIITMGALGSLLNIVKNYREAEGLNRKALALAKKVFGPRHYRTLVIMDFLGVSLKGLDRLEEAEEILRDALKLRETESRKEHPDTRMCLKHLVSVLIRQGRHREASKLQVEFLLTENALMP